MKNKIIISCCLFLLTALYAKAQAPFYDEIQHFKKQDGAHFPAKQQILFVGSSSFTKWTDIKDYFPAYPIINRGFGGSSLPDVIRYANDIIFSYQPKQVVIYCGENDLASADTVTATMVVDRFKKLFVLIRQQLPTATVTFVSLKPSPSRQRLWPKMIDVNTQIKNYLRKKKKTSFIDVYQKMFNKNGTVMQDIFIEDSLHMNAKGYAIWQKIMTPYLYK